MLGSKHLAVQINDPLPALMGDAQVAETVLDVAVDNVPEECRVGVAKIGRGGKAELGRHASFGELVKQRWQLLRAVWIGELPNEICCPYEARIVCRPLVFAIMRDGKASAFDVRRQNFRVDNRVSSKTFPYEALATVDVIGA